MNPQMQERSPSKFICWKLKLFLRGNRGAMETRIVEPLGEKTASDGAYLQPGPQETLTDLAKTRTPEVRPRPSVPSGRPLGPHTAACGTIGESAAGPGPSEARIHSSPRRQKRGGSAGRPPPRNARGSAPAAGPGCPAATDPTLQRRASKHKR